MIKLKDLLKNKTIREATTTGMSTGAKRSKGSETSKAQSDADTHSDTEPSPQIPDVGKWTHPWSRATTNITKGQKQPDLGWQFTKPRSATTYDQGSQSDWSSAATSRGYTKSDAKDTTNPDMDNPDWNTWKDTSDTHDTEKERSAEREKGQPLSQIGYGSRTGGMKGKGGGTGKGKGKDKKKA